MKQLSLKTVVLALNFLFFGLLSALIMKLIRRLGIWRALISRAVFNRIGIYPIRDMPVLIFLFNKFGRLRMILFVYVAARFWHFFEKTFLKKSSHFVAVSVTS